MLVEIPDPDVILSVIIAFLVGLIGLFTYYKIRPWIKINPSIDASQVERLEYYERQLIDMKIRLDSLELEGKDSNSDNIDLELRQFIKKSEKSETIDKPVEPIKPIVEPSQTPPSIPKIDHNNAVDHVLHLITNKAMTSRDIQITLKRSREHTSRLMKKLFDDGFVERNTESKPYSYFISDKGKKKIGLLESKISV